MLDFIKNIFKGKPGEAKAPAPRREEQRPAGAAPANKPSRILVETEEPVFRIGQTVRAPGLGDFTVHDIKGGKGKSGMGVVYIVLDVSSMTPYAVKTFQKWVLGTPDLIQRFLREAETWIRLEQHHNIVRAYYVTTINDQPHIFLEYVAGSDLRKKISAGPMPIRDILRYSIQFCRGMAHAAKKVPGLVHRDVKPENCMFTPDDILKVTDFGLVKVLAQADILPAVGATGAEEIGDELASQVFRTRVGEMGVGTMPYMAPEQFTDFANVTVTADVYSFGVMLYEMLTGKRPFKARKPEDFYYQHLKVTPLDPLTMRNDVGVELSIITMRCMAKKSDQRYQNFDALEKDLAALLKKQFKESLPLAAKEELDAWEIVNKGAALSNLDRDKEALEYFDKALKLLPTFDAAWLNKGVVLAKRKKYDEAIACYAKAVEYNPNSADAWYNTGYANQHKGELETSLEAYDRAITLNPLFEAAWLNKGVILRRLKREQEALDSYDRVIAINAGSAVAWYNKGFALSQLGRVREALECYEKALAINPQFLEVWLNRGVALRKSNRLIEALVCYDKALAIHGRHPEAWYNKGLVLLKLGKKRESQEAFQKAAALDPKIAEQLKQQGLYS
ncbi:MAG: tetratricopeptide repeat protein [Acidobacteria bacterium]|nr:tetratricopeptide repeat protein [Acidobacteriota bacterium]